MLFHLLGQSVHNQYVSTTCISLSIDMPQPWLLSTPIPLNQTYCKGKSACCDSLALRIVSWDLLSTAWYQSRPNTISSAFIIKPCSLLSIDCAYHQTVIDTKHSNKIALGPRVHHASSPAALQHQMMQQQGCRSTQCSGKVVEVLLSCAVSLGTEGRCRRASFSLFIV